VVDVPEAKPILAALAARGWRLGDILITHHHDDHIDGVAALRARPARGWWGPPPMPIACPRWTVPCPRTGADVWAARRAVVIDVPGHTVGHIAFHFPASRLVFTGDSLMAGGLRAAVRGTAAQMWAACQRLAALPGNAGLFGA
jgi:hydroxyacylglutathione hydrolase